MTAQSNPELEAALAAVTPSNVRIGWRDRRKRPGVDAPGRTAHVAHAVDRRQREYASGRALLRALIGRPVSIPSRPDRTASLPAGIQGSLAHDNELVVAAISDDPSVIAVGVDVEPLTTLSDETARSNPEIGRSRSGRAPSLHPEGGRLQGLERPWWSDAGSSRCPAHGGRPPLYR